jgi:membrane protease YdiL (CAAX protease family)
MKEDSDASQPSPAELFPKILPSIFWIIVYFALQIVAGIVGFAIAVIQHPALQAQVKNPSFLDDNIAVLAVPILWSLLVSSALLCLGLWWYISRDRRAETIGLTDFGTMRLPNALGLALVLIVGGTVLNALYSIYIVPDVELQAEMNRIMQAVPNTVIDQTLRFVMVAVLGPLVEELLFRGLLQKSFMHYMRPGYAIALAAFLFALVHMQPLATPALMVLGAAFGYLYYKTGSLRLTIMLHMINNAAALYFGT